MVLEFEDLDDFLVADEFAEEVLFGDDETPVMAIFDQGWFRLDDSTPDITTHKPMLTCRTDDIADFEQDDPVVVRGTDYTILEKQPDGTGMSVVLLQRV